MKKASLLLIGFVLFTGYSLHAQVAVNNDGSSAHSSAMLDVKSTNKGVLIPRIAKDDIESINSPANGLMVFNTDDDRLYIFIASELKWKEVSFGSGEILYPATMTIGTGGACANTTVNGNYSTNIALTASNTVTLDATVTSAGAWSITTDTINGYSFSGNGIIPSTGTIQLTLDGSGTPMANQTDSFTATLNIPSGGSSCTFDVIVACYLDCDDGDLCTDDFFDAVNCSCSHIPVDCDDGDPNTQDFCDPATGGCVNIPTTINGKTGQEKKSDSKGISK